LLKNFGLTNIFKLITAASYKLSSDGTCLTVYILYCVICFEVI